jgi:hypothetical protein
MGGDGGGAENETGNPPSVRFLGAQFVVPHPPGCVPGRYIPGCPNPREFEKQEGEVAVSLTMDLIRSLYTTVPRSSCWLLVVILMLCQPTAAIGLVEQHQVMTEGQCFAVVTMYRRPSNW